MPARIIEHNNIRYRVRVSVGPSIDPNDQRPLNVNDDSNPVLIDTDEFVGHVMFRIKGQNQVQGYAQGQELDGFKPVPDSKWFENAATAGKGANLLNSLQIMGRFKREWSGDQLGVFERPLRLPPLTSIAIKFFKTLEPSLQIELQCPKPYFASPLLSIMNTLHISERTKDKDGHEQSIPKWPSQKGEPLVEDSVLGIQEGDMKKKIKIGTDCIARRSYFSKLGHLGQHRFLPQHVYGFELFNHILDCSNLSVKLPGFSVELFKCFNGQVYLYRLYDMATITDTDYDSSTVSSTSLSSSSSSLTCTATENKTTTSAPYNWKLDPNTRYRLRVLAGPGPDRNNLRPLNVNDDGNPIFIDTDEFCGYISFRIKDLDKVHGYAQGQRDDGLGTVPNSKWFDLPVPGTNTKNRNLNSIRFGGRFKREWAGDQIIFAAELDRRIERMPPCTSVGIKLLQFIDPAVKIDLLSDLPYVRSPLIVAMNTVCVSSLIQDQDQDQGQNQDQNHNQDQSQEQNQDQDKDKEQDQDQGHSTAQTTTEATVEGELKRKLVPRWSSPNGEHVSEDTHLVFKHLDAHSADNDAKDSSSTVAPAQVQTPLTSRQRQHYFAKPKNLMRHRYRTDQVYDFEFTSAGGLVDYANFKVKLPCFSIDALRYWDGQTGKFFVKTADSSVIFFTILIEPVPVEV
ncbi:hypothetical protein BGX28_009817 [Mortierella sp. GBA30]|nr:hypothetical protein BGX28_009817 [Mortierella sp. GBA30]